MALTMRIAAAGAAKKYIVYFSVDNQQLLGKSVGTGTSIDNMSIV